MASWSILCGICAALVPGVALAEGWDDVASGAADVRGLGRVAFSVGYSSVGYDHFRSEVTVEWRDGGVRRQSLYDGIYDRPPARLWGADGLLCLSMQACARYEDVCRTQILAYRYDPAAKRFDEVSGSAGCGE